MKQSFYGHGKLMISGEYFVLDGAHALALPTKFGQHLEIDSFPDSKNEIHWRSIASDASVWMEVRLRKDDLQILSPISPEAERLQQIFQAILKQNESCLSSEQSLSFCSRLEFPNNWGLGSSSTLIWCLSQWAKIDPYLLLADTFGGSGYDIACAAADGPIVYHNEKNNKRRVESVRFDPPFKQNLCFVHLGKKQNSREGIKSYSSISKPREAIVEELNAITNDMLLAVDQAAFAVLMFRHELLISQFLDSDMVKRRLFKEFPGSIKSLGAWGGDFVLACSDLSFEEQKKWFEKADYPLSLSFDELIL